MSGAGYGPHVSKSALEQWLCEEEESKQGRPHGLAGVQERTQRLYEQLSTSPSRSYGRRRASQTIVFFTSPSRRLLTTPSMRPRVPRSRSSLPIVGLAFR